MQARSVDNTAEFLEQISSFGRGNQWGCEGVWLLNVREEKESNAVPNYLLIYVKPQRSERRHPKHVSITYDMGDGKSETCRLFSFNCLLLLKSRKSNPS